MAYTITQTCNGCGACARKCPVHAISGERKQVHVIAPDLCIDCGACGRTCPTRAILDPHGQVTQPIKPSQWPKPAWNYRDCVECRICIQACPTSSINLLRYQSLPKNGLKPSYPFLQHVKTCIGCGFCASKCPTLAIHMETSLAAEPAASD
ncbi:MAG TPA: 4Fe-4S binding protein [Anaerolineaceae bacterium]|nr:4Fe-4S binding protein [Anaerolineaceae bacterium]